MEKHVGLDICSCHIRIHHGDVMNSTKVANFLWRKHVESKKKTPSKTFQENFGGSVGSSLWRDLANVRQSMGVKMPGVWNKATVTDPCRHRANHVFWRPMFEESHPLYCKSQWFFFRFVIDTRTMSIVSDVTHSVVCFMIQKAPTKSGLGLVHRDFTWSIGDVNPFCDALGLGGNSGVGAVRLAQTPGLPEPVDGSTSTHTMGLRQADL